MIGWLEKVVKNEQTVVREGNLMHTDDEAP